MHKAIWVAILSVSSLAHADPIAPTSAPAAPAHNNRSLFALWGKIREPLPGDSQPMGTYTAGCIAGAVKLPMDGPGFSVMRPSRARYYGHPELVAFIENLGQELERQKLGRVLVGDMGRPRGGPMINGHNSHQIGLDVDLWLRLRRKKPSRRERETLSAESFVRDDSHVTHRWSDQERTFTSLAASSDRVERIFVHPAIKRDLCAKFAGAPWLYKIRPWWAHQDHLHVRLRCPAGSAACKSQEPLNPADPQCGKELDWWFTPEAKEEGAKKDAAYKERAFPELPSECEKMVDGIPGAEKK